MEGSLFLRQLLICNSGCGAYCLELENWYGDRCGPLIYLGINNHNNNSLRIFSKLITTIPTRRLPKKLALGAASPKEIEMFERDEFDEGIDDMGKRGQILWIRGLNRLQHQVKDCI